MYIWKNPIPNTQFQKGISKDPISANILPEYWPSVSPCLMTPYSSHSYMVRMTVARWWWWSSITVTSRVMRIMITVTCRLPPPPELPDPALCDKLPLSCLQQHICHHHHQYHRHRLCHHWHHLHHTWALRVIVSQWFKVAWVTWKLMLSLWW